MNYLFTYRQANRGIIAQYFDEASCTWKVVITRKPSHLIEIVRWLWCAQFCTRM